MGFSEHVLLPGLWAVLIVWEVRLFWTQPAYLGILPAELFFLIVFVDASDSGLASLLHLISYTLLPISAIVYILGFVLVCVRFILLLPLSIILPLLFLIYFGLYILVSRFLLLSRLLLSALLSLISKICIVRWPRFRRKPQGAPGSKCVDGCSRSLESKLCPTCESLVDASALLTGTCWLFTRPVEAHLHYTERDLKQSAESCALCYLLLDSKSATSHTASSSASQYGSISNLEAAAERLTVKIWERRHVLVQPLLRIQLIGRGFESRPLAVGQVRNAQVSKYHNCDVSNETTSPAIMRWAQQQINSCRDGHSNCGTYYMDKSRSYFRPTRLIDVGEKGNTSVRLIVTSELSTRKLADRYVALSYCWGNSCKTLLLEENLEAMKQPTDFRTWDASYGHAISITRDLGIRYLWIDALCIIQCQENQQDWRRESPTMGLVYANATCVLSATASEDSAGGCVFPKMIFAGGCHLRQHGDTSLDITPSARQDTVMADLFTAKVESARLAKRAWTFQERVLASRILHFCDGVVLFECNEMQASSSHGFGQPYPKRTDVSLDGKMQVPVGPEPPPSPFLPSIRIPTFVPPHFSADSMLTWSTEDVWEANVSTRPISRPARGGRMVNRTVMHWNQFTRFSAFFDFLDISDLIDSFRDFSSYRKYVSWRTWRGDAVESARLGMRGAFETLTRFKGITLAEQIEFHSCWYQIVENYSVRNLTKHTDKLAAIEGLAIFVPFNFIAGLWEDVFAINLLWTLAELSETRPDRKIPTWSWASIDGRISHQLRVRASSNRFARGSWKDLDLYITQASPRRELTPGLCVQAVEIALRVPLFKLNVSKAHFIPDIILSDKEHEGLLCLTVLSFRNIHVFPYVAARQLHGIVVQETASSAQNYERVGYFWTMDQAAIKEVLQGLSQVALSTIELI